MTRPVARTASGASGAIGGSPGARRPPALAPRRPASILERESGMTAPDPIGDAYRELLARRDEPSGIPDQRVEDICSQLKSAMAAALRKAAAEPQSDPRPCGNGKNHGLWLSMCNLYSLTKGQAAIREWFRARHDRTGNLPLFPGIFPDQMAPIVRSSADGERELVMVS
jgi:hypothetical protein